MADLLEEQRKLLFDTLMRSGNFYEGSDQAGQASQSLLQSLMRQVSGEDSPFTQTVVNNMLADSASGNAGNHSRERELAQRAMANAGLTGSGLEASALMSAQARAAQAARTGRRDIQTRAQLENFNARQQANSQAMQFLGQQAQQRQAASFQEAGYRSQMHETGDASNMSNQPQQAQQPAQPQAPQPALARATPARPMQYGLSNKTLLMPTQNANYWGGNSGGFGGVGGDMSGTGNLANANAMYQQQVQQQQRDRMELQRLQADWDMNYGGRA